MERSEFGHCWEERLSHWERLEHVYRLREKMEPGKEGMPEVKKRRDRERSQSSEVLEGLSILQPGWFWAGPLFMLGLALPSSDPTHSSKTHSWSQPSQLIDSKYTTTLPVSSNFTFHKDYFTLPPSSKAPSLHDFPSHHHLTSYFIEKMQIVKREHSQICTLPHTCVQCLSPSSFCRGSINASCWAS